MQSDVNPVARLLFPYMLCMPFGNRTRETTLQNEIETKQQSQMNKYLLRRRFCQTKFKLTPCLNLQLFRAPGFKLRSNSLSLSYPSTHTTRNRPDLRQTVATAKKPRAPRLSEFVFTRLFMQRYTLFWDHLIPGKGERKECVSLGSKKMHLEGSKNIMAGFGLVSP